MASLLDNPLTAPEIEGGLDSLSSDLAYLLADSNLPDDVRARIGIIGYNSMAVFAKAGSSITEVRNWIKNDIGLDVTHGIAQRTCQAQITTAWEAAGKRIEHKQAEEAEVRASDGPIPRSLQKATYVDLNRAFSKRHRELKDKETPAKAYVELRFEQIEDGELVAETLKDVISREEATACDADPKQPLFAFKADGSIKVRNSKLSGELPTTPEDFRRKIRLLGVCWEFVKLKFPLNRTVADLSLGYWDTYLEWLLGEDVYGLKVQDDLGGTVYRPSWHLLLGFEFQIRRAAYKNVNNYGRPLAQALTDARNDTALAQKYFHGPMALAGGAAAAAHGTRTPSKGTGGGGGARPAEGVEAPSASQGRGSQRPDNRRKRKSPPSAPPKPAATAAKKARTSWKSETTNKTDDGREKCFKYQRGQCTDSSKCGRLHLCTLCGEGHPLKECPQKLKKAADNKKK
jgi:hypothetical protein